MAAAVIVVNQPTAVDVGKRIGIPGRARDDVELGVPVQLVNNDDTGVRSWRWRMVNRPEGSGAVLSSPTSASTTFTPDVEGGSWLIELIVNEGNQGEIDRTVVAIRDSFGRRIPAAREDEEANWLIGGVQNTDGWWPDLIKFLQGIGGTSFAFDWKDSVRVATTAAGTLANDFENGDTIDGVVLATGDRILIKNQAAAEENGIYVVQASGAPARSADANEDGEVTAMLAVAVSEGSTNADTIWILTTNDPITLDSTGLTFVQFASTATDPDAIHDNVAGEIVAVTEKVSPGASDWLLIEDGDDSNNKKRIQIGNLPAGASSDTLSDVLARDAGGAGVMLHGQSIVGEDDGGPGNIGGQVTLKAGVGNATTGGLAELLGGASIGGSADGGGIRVFGGNATGTGNGGNVQIGGGAGTAAGQVIGTGSLFDWSGGDATFSDNIGVAGQGFFAGAVSGDLVSGTDVGIGDVEAANHGLSIITGTANTGGVFFSDGTTNSWIQYQHNNNLFVFGVEGSNELVLTAGSLNPAAALGLDLGSSSNPFSQFYAGVPNWGVQQVGDASASLGASHFVRVTLDSTNRTLTLPSAVTGHSYTIEVTFVASGSAVLSLDDAAGDTIMGGAGPVTLATNTGQAGTLCIRVWAQDTTDWRVCQCGPEVQTFSVTGTYNKPAGATYYRAVLIGGAGGGGSGATSSNSSGSSGGGGAHQITEGFAAQLGATESVVVGSGGTGGAAQTGSGAGNDGGDGSASTFAGASAPGGTGGTGGAGGDTPGQQGWGTGAYSSKWTASRGVNESAGAGGVGGGGVTTEGFRSRGGGGGGAGGRRTLAGNDGGDGGSSAAVGAAETGGGGAAGAAGAAGSAGASRADTLIGEAGQGGGGGGGANGGNGMPGGDGGVPGGAGAGGGAGDDGAAADSGAGGDGAAGRVWVISW